MKFAELFARKQTLSFEVFPPKRTMPVDTVYAALGALAELAPDYISVTYGAGGTANCAATVDIAATVEARYGIASVAHMPCIYLTKEEAEAQLAQFKARGIESVLALRGDITPGVATPGAFHYASELIEFIRQRGDFHVVAACYPEGHPAAGGLERDLVHLKKKVDAGAGQLITQLFFDNRLFYRFRDRAYKLGIRVPMEAGIMPAANNAQIARMVGLCGASIPAALAAIMARYEGDPTAQRDAGISYAAAQIVDLLAHGVDGIHLYTMNNPLIARRICEAVAPYVRGGAAGS